MVGLFVNLQLIGTSSYVDLQKIFQSEEPAQAHHVWRASLSRQLFGVLLRFDGDIPDWAMNIFSRTLPVLVLVHHCRLIYGSGPNTTETPRLAFAVLLQDAGNRYRLCRNDKGIPWHIFLDGLAPKREDRCPDYTDPNVFPALWQQSPVSEKTAADRP